MIPLPAISLLAMVFCYACSAVPTSLVTPAPKSPVEDLGKRSVVQGCGYFSENPSMHVGCNGGSICSSSPGASTWGCCGSSSCYIPATCENADTPYCGGITASLCPYSPIMKCTYGSSSKCLTFIRQTADGDTAKVTSWGCGSTPTIFIIVAESSSLSATSSSFGSQTMVRYSSGIPSQSSSSTSSSSGLSMGGKAGLGVGVAVGGLIILGAVAFIFYRAGKRSQADRAANEDISAGVVSKPELAGTQLLEHGGKQVLNEDGGVNKAPPVSTERAELDGVGNTVELEGSSKLNT